MNENIKRELISYKDEIDWIVNTIKGSSAVSSDDEDQFYSGKTDPDYDNEEIPPPYTKKYIRRRINVFLSFFHQELIETFTSHTNKEISILDLGAGTGAVQWALYLLLGTLEKMNRLNNPKKNISIVNMDSSRPMLDYNKKLWERFFEEKIKQSKSFTINPTWKCQDLKSINNYNDLKTPSIITASYLLPYHDKDKIIDIINRLVRKYECSLLLTTSSEKGCGLEKKITSAQPKFSDCTEYPVYGRYNCRLLFNSFSHWQENFRKGVIVWKG